MSVVSTIFNRDQGLWTYRLWKGTIDFSFPACYFDEAAATLAAAECAENQPRCLFSQRREFVAIRNEGGLHAVIVRLPADTSQRMTCEKIRRFSHITLPEILDCARKRGLPCVPNFFEEPNTV